MAATSANYRHPVPIVRACCPPPRRAACSRGALRVAGGRGHVGFRVASSACMVARLCCALRQPPGLSPRSWLPGLRGLGSACPARFCVLGGWLRRGRAPGPSSGRCSALGSVRCWPVLPPPAALPAVRGWLASPLVRPSLLLVVCRGRALVWLRRGGGGSPACGALRPLLASPPPGFLSAAPPPSLGSWFGVGSRVLRGASAAQGAQSRAEMWTEGDKLDSTHRARIDRPGAATAPKQPSPVGYQLRY